nr:LysR family transcriptional regulator [Microbacterium sp.]
MVSKMIIAYRDIRPATAEARVDLNLIKVFVAIYETRSLTVAGERLFVTQSAVSQSLARLREQLDDVLFERTGRGMRPTPLADALFPSFREALMAIERTLETVHGFDPATSERTFRLALSELGEIGWMPAIFTALHDEAPHARVEVIHLDSGSVVDLLSRGNVDLAITPLDLAGDFARTPIKREKYVAVQAASGSAAQRMTLEQYRTAPRVTVASDSGAHLLEAAHRQIDDLPDAIMSVQHFATLPPLLVRNPDLIAAIPETIAAGWASSWPITAGPLPFEMEPIALDIYRRATTQHAGALDWFSDVVSRTVATSGADFEMIRGEGRHPATRQCSIVVGKHLRRPVPLQLQARRCHWGVQVDQRPLWVANQDGSVPPRHRCRLLDDIELVTEH